MYFKSTAIPKKIKPKTDGPGYIRLRWVTGALKEIDKTGHTKPSGFHTAVPSPSLPRIPLI
jgi:hypothetical protein